MFFPESRVRVYLYGQPVDMRKSFDGLYAVARAAFPQDPTGGDLYVFVNRSGAQIKVLYFDRSGWCVWAKRLEAGRFIGDWSKVHTNEIDCTRLKLLLEGIEPQRYLKRYRHVPPAGERCGVRPDSARKGNSGHSRGASMGGCVA
ncbi:MAG: IS66 family insertion sequence element accessory protein TnpB [Rubrivivax sp.]|nr:IS66 family insertion sequence element accessory protein TnpB [Rubrivivax sp.]MDP3086484.1 IS66 family insertion sequence element accessory protein TnpB [Rubrivivax sp.]